MGAAHICEPTQLAGFWWRRGRVELPVQKVSHHGIYVRSRRCYVYLEADASDGRWSRQRLQIFLSVALCVATPHLKFSALIRDA